MHLAVNGWTLATSPEAPRSAYLIEFLTMLVEESDGVALTLLHPSGDFSDPPVEVNTIAVNCSRSPWGRFVFEQWLLPRSAKRSGADLLFYPYAASPLASPVPVVALNADSSAIGRSTLVERLRWAFGRAGVVGAKRILTYEDVPSPSFIERREHLIRLPGWVGDGFRVLAGEADRELRASLELEEGYVLCHGLEAESARALAAAWTWVDPTVGDYVPLVICGVDDDAQRALTEAARDLDVRGSMRVLRDVAFDHLPALYRGARVFVQNSSRAAGQVFRWAMACGVPVAAPRGTPADRILGDAAYLVEPGNVRALGAAILTLIVEDQVHERLRQRGLMRAAHYHKETARRRWRRALSSSP